MSTFIEPSIGVTVLETESADLQVELLVTHLLIFLQQEVKLPDWIKVEKEVTEDEEYTSYMIARANKK
jgi:CYTH domain-containing protein